MDKCMLHGEGSVPSRGEKRTGLVILITLVMMMTEIGSGIVFGSMALLADGIHMGTHAAALMITLVAYWIARKNRNNRNFAFGTGKVGVLGGFTSAVILLIAALGMSWEALERLMNPHDIRFGEALVVAVVGLVVNIVSAFLLGHDHSHSHSHSHGEHECSHSHGEKHDHNLRAAYLHVIADAITSVAAIAALLAGRWFNAVWLDPVVAIVGSLVILKWAVGLLKDTGAVLLDYTKEEPLREQAGNIVSRYGHEIHDFHVWKIDASGLGLILSLAGKSHEKDSLMREELMRELSLVHCTVECI